MTFVFHVNKIGDDRYSATIIDTDERIQKLVDEAAVIGITDYEGAMNSLRELNRETVNNTIQESMKRDGAISKMFQAIDDKWDEENFIREELNNIPPTDDEKSLARDKFIQDYCCQESFTSAAANIDEGEKVDPADTTGMILAGGKKRKKTKKRKHKRKKKTRRRKK